MFRIPENILTTIPGWGKGWTTDDPTKAIAVVRLIVPHDVLYIFEYTERSKDGGIYVYCIIEEGKPKVFKATGNQLKEKFGDIHFDPDWKPSKMSEVLKAS